MTCFVAKDRDMRLRPSVPESDLRSRDRYFSVSSCVSIATDSSM